MSCCTPKNKCQTPPASASAIPKVAGVNSAGCVVALDPAPQGFILTQGTNGAYWNTPCVEYTVVDTAPNLLVVDENNCKRLLLTGTEGQVLSINADDELYFADNAAAATYTVENIGAGEPVYSMQVGDTFQFNSLVAGDGMSISAPVGGEITITNTDPAPTLQSDGAGEDVYTGTASNIAHFSSLVAGANVTITRTIDNELSIAAPTVAGNLVQENRIVFIDKQYGNDGTGTIGRRDLPFATIPNRFATNWSGGYVEPWVMHINPFFNTNVNIGGTDLCPDTNRSYITQIASTTRFYKGELQAYDLRFGVIPNYVIEFVGINFNHGTSFPLFDLSVGGALNANGTREVRLVFRDCVFDRGGSNALFIACGNSNNKLPIRLSFINCVFILRTSSPLGLLHMLSNAGGDAAPTDAGIDGNNKHWILFKDCIITKSFSSAAGLQYLVSGPGSANNTVIRVIGEMYSDWLTSGITGCAGATLEGASNLIVGNQWVDINQA